MIRCRRDFFNTYPLDPPDEDRRSGAGAEFDAGAATDEDVGAVEEPVTTSSTCIPDAADDDATDVLDALTGRPRRSSCAAPARLNALALCGDDDVNA